ncbi:MAG: TonB-dependent receptor, partial [Bacteroidota bacterium]
AESIIGDDLTERKHEVNFWGTNFLYKRKWFTRWKSELSVSHADYYMKNEDKSNSVSIGENNQINISNYLKNTEAKISLLYRFNRKGKLGIGYQFNAYQNYFNYNEQLSFEEDLFNELKASASSQGVFVKYHYSWKDKIDFQPQLRIDQVLGNKKWRINPVMSFHYKALPNLWIKTSYGQYFQLIRSLRQGELQVSNVSESIWLLADGSLQGGDEENLPNILSRQFSIGALFKKNAWLIDFDLFWKRTDNLSSINQFESNQFFGFELGNAETTGLELMLKKTFGRYQTWMSYSHSRVVNRFEGLSDLPFPSSYDRPHQFRWVHNLFLAPLEFSMGWILKSGSPYTIADKISFGPNPNNPDGSESPELVYGPINGERLPMYHRLDFSVWYRFENMAPAFSGQIGFSVQNIYNRKNIWQRFYFVEDLDNNDNFEIIEEERYFLGFTPNLSVQLNF